MGPAAQSFLAEEQSAWQPFEALLALTDAQVQTPVEAAHGWSGRDLIAHEIAWLADAIDVARELDAGGGGEARRRSQDAFAARGDEINAEIQATWAGLTIAEVRERAGVMRAELRELLAAVPDARWSGSAEDVHFFHIYTVEHYQDHAGDLAAILDAARGTS